MIKFIKQKKNNLHNNFRFKIAFGLSVLFLCFSLLNYSTIVYAGGDNPSPDCTGKTGTALEICKQCSNLTGQPKIKCEQDIRMNPPREGEGKNPAPAPDTDFSERKEQNAQDCNDTSGNLTRSNCRIVDYLIVITNILSALVGIVVIIVIIIGGIQYSASSGDPNAAAAAKKRISNALLALLAFALMYGFLQWIIPGGVF